MPEGSSESPQLTANRSWAGYGIVAAIVVAVAVLLSGRNKVSPPSNSSVLAVALELPEFVEVPEGPFLMGSDKASDALAFDNERWSPNEARGTVNLPTFYIGRHEVTVAQYQSFVVATERKVEPQALSAPSTHPVTFVSWPDAVAYCRWLESIMRVSPATPAALKARLDSGWHVALPSEAEWEKAARGPDGRRYPWGDGPPKGRANLQSQGTVPVGSIACADCAYGLSDMSGNVWEWTRSPYQPYPFDPGDDNNTIGSDALWVMRGGAFNDSEQMGRVTTRGAADPGARRAFIGFRVVISSN